LLLDTNSMAVTSEADWVSARSAWPGVDVPQEEFLAFVADRVEATHPLPPHDDTALAARFSQARIDDLYLACACARGDSLAIAAFERAYFSEIDHALRSLRANTPPPLDEVRQLVRHKLFVAEPGSKPGIERYSGRGDLRNWFRVTVHRLLLNLLMRGSPEIPLDDRLFSHLLGGEDVSRNDFPKEHYKAEFRTAFHEAFGGLSTREVSVLRYAFGEELTTEAIGRVYGVHKSTASRWVVAAHDALLTRVKAILIARLDLSEDEYASVLRRVRDSLELSLERFLKVKDS
jgi:RNA polymerase sigma-70 factor, ECF subfamily